MLNFQVNKMVSLAQKGDPYARTALLARSRSFVSKAASEICSRPLRWHEDRELDIAVKAFDEAIDTFSRRQGEENFLNFAQKLIELRIRQQGTGGERQDSPGRPGEDPEGRPLQGKHCEARRRKRIACLWERHKEVMEEYGVSCDDLVGGRDRTCGPWNRVEVLLQSARRSLRKCWDDLKEAGA